MGRWQNLAREITDTHDNSDRSDKSPHRAVVEEPIVPIVPIVASKPFNTGDYDERATIQTASGAQQRIHRRIDDQSPGRVNIWALNGGKNGKITC